MQHFLAGIFVTSAVLCSIENFQKVLRDSVIGANKNRDGQGNNEGAILFF